MAESETACGGLRDRLDVLTFAETDGGWTWETERQTWGKVTSTGRKAVFSTEGQGAPGVEIILRRQAIGRDKALRWMGRHVAIVDARPEGRGHIRVSGALANRVECSTEDKTGSTTTFPALLTEKYLRHEQLEPYAMNTITYVLVTPKQIDLRRGTLVVAAGTAYEVQLGHVLDEAQNEFEIVRKVDL